MSTEAATAGDLREVVVVGGGIAGLAAAWALRDREVLLLEAEDRIGGRVKSEPRGRYWLNLGAHVFAGEDSATGRLLDELRLEATTVPGTLTAVALNGRVVTGGRLETYPFRLPLALADRLALIRVGLRLRSAVSRYGKIARARPGERATSRQARILEFLGERSFSDFLGPVPGDVDALFRPTIQRSSGEPEDVAAGYGVGYFHLVWNRDAGLSRNISGGPSTLTATIAGALDSRILLGSRVEEVVPDATRVRVRFERDGQPQEVQARFVVMAVPAYAARAIVRELPETTERALGEIAYGPYVVAGLLTRETSPMPYDRLYALAVAKKSFNMLFNTANTLRARELRREPGGSLMVYSGAKLGRRLLELDDDQIAARYLDDLHDVFPQTKGIVEEIRIQRWEYGLPYPRPGRNTLQSALERSLGRIFLAGDYLGTWYTETAIQTGIAAARAIRVQLGADRASVV